MILTVEAETESILIDVQHESVTRKSISAGSQKKRESKGGGQKLSV